ncbi:putative DUF2406 domain protein [Rosellinia necatrix]|uniref:Putative DUF2406 domain protein n=1 Tax=Rosellinia necatrix TaxID=77044 RepID=A0A1S7UJC5_ROSNE|nr:putative DUF2406 domain protein [Rosellinia necatrix]
MASSTSYSRHPLPAPPQQDQSYTTYQPQPPAAQDYQYQPRNQPQQQTQLQQHPQHRQQQQWEQQREQQQRPPPVKVPDIKPQQQQQRVRPKSRAFSFRSDKSQKSANGPTHKINLTETSAEKEAKRLHSKADPRMALNEREPAMEAQTVSERPALRSIQHRDAFGNLIADPDRSNPTRNRWERPLDTIRGFEAAIDGGYNRKSFYRPETESVAGWNRRSSYYGGEQTRISPQRQNPISGPIRPDNGRPAQESFYGGRSNRTDGNTYDQRQSAMVGSSRDSYYEGFDGGPYSNGGPSTGTRNKYPRNQSEPQLSGRERNVYPIPNNHRSYETVASGSGTGSMGEPAGYQTDPTSSENSSIDRRSPPKRQQPMNDYGISFGQTPSYQAPGVGLGHGAVGNPPPLPRKEQGPLLRKPSKAPSSNGKSQERPDLGEKRKSWFMRRFSKNS